MARECGLRLAKSGSQALNQGMDREGTTKSVRPALMKGLTRSLLVIGTALLLFGAGSAVHPHEWKPNDDAVHFDGGEEARGYVKLGREFCIFSSGVILLSIGLYLFTSRWQIWGRTVGPESGNHK